mgnify:CR=1 FL=1
MAFICLFSNVFPLAPLMAFVSNLFEIQVDRTKVVYLKRRPFPMGAENMGIWRSFFLFITIFGTVISVSVLVVTAWAFDIAGSRNVLYQLVVILAGVGIFKVLLALFIPDVPTKFMQIQKRHENIVNWVLELEPMIFDKEVKARIAKVDNGIFA